MNSRHFSACIHAFMASVLGSLGRYHSGSSGTFFGALGGPLSLFSGMHLLDMLTYQYIHMGVGRPDELPVLSSET
jgi:hypothetical protein